MIRILFICHGNICRSVAAEMVLRQMIAERGLEGRIAVDSAATTREEIGHGVYPPMRKALDRQGVPCVSHAARQTVRQDYARYDRIIGMDGENMDDMRRIYGGDPAGKLSLLAAWAGENREIDDPWYTRDFDGCLRDIIRCCDALLRALCSGGQSEREAEH